MELDEQEGTVAVTGELVDPESSSQGCPSPGAKTVAAQGKIQPRNLQMKAGSFFFNAIKLFHFTASPSDSAAF